MFICALQVMCSFEYLRYVVLNVSGTASVLFTLVEVGGFVCINESYRVLV